MTLKVRFDAGVCAGLGVCVGICPEVFELHDDGYAIVAVSEVPQEFEDAVRKAVNQCPARAISLSDDPGTDSTNIQILRTPV